MTTAENKALLQNIFAELAKGNPGPFVDAMADDFAWTISGTTAWSKTYRGKKVVVEELLGTLRERLEPPIVTIGQRFIADGDFVAVEACGKNRTKEGVPYENKYCFVFRVADGKLFELIEYLDTELVTRAFGRQAGASATALIAPLRGRGRARERGDLDLVDRLFQLARDLYRFADQGLPDP